MPFFRPPRLAKVWERMRQIGSPLHAADDAENYLRGIKVGSSVVTASESVGRRSKA